MQINKQKKKIGYGVTVHPWKNGCKPVYIHARGHYVLLKRMKWNYSSWFAGNSTKLNVEGVNHEQTPGCVRGGEGWYTGTEKSMTGYMPGCEQKLKVKSRKWRTSKKENWTVKNPSKYAMIPFILCLYMDLCIQIRKRSYISIWKPIRIPLILSRKQKQKQQINTYDSLLVKTPESLYMCT